MTGRRWIANGALAALVLGAFVLLAYPPGSSSFYPACPIFTYLHVQCPGCGTTRALAELLRGHLLEAIRLNALSVALIPFAFGYGAVCYVRAIRSGAFRWPRAADRTGYALLGIATVFGIVRDVL